MRWRMVGILVGVAALAGSVMAPAAANEPVVVVPGGTEALPPELAEPEPPEPPAEVVQRHDTVERAVEAGSTEAAGTLTVTPDTGLVHEQVVTLHGTGWTPRHEFIAIQCGPPPLTFDSCESNEFDDDDIFRAGANGNFTSTLPVEVIIDDRHGAIDCRVVTCRVGVVDLWTEALRFTDVAFDPGGPDPTRPQIAATPDTGLVDGDRITVTGTDLPVVEDFLPLVQLTYCRTPITRDADCDKHQTQLAELDEDDSLETELWASAILELPSGPYDCRTGTCAVIVTPESFFNGLGELSEAGVADLEFDPGGPLRPPPTLTADPDTGLHDGDAVELHAAGFDPHRGFTVSQCSADATSSRDCVGGVFSFGAASTSDFDLFFGVLAKFVDGRGRTVDCRVDPCSVILAHGDFGRHARAELHFDPDAPLIDPSISVTPSTGLHDGDEVTITGTNWASGQPILINQCPAGATDVFECDFDSFTVTWPDDERRAVPVARTEAALEAGSTFEATFEVSARIDGERHPVDCRQVACEILASDDTGARSARATLAFDQAVPPISASPSFTG